MPNIFLEENKAQIKKIKKLDVEFYSTFISLWYKTNLMKIGAFATPVHSFEDQKLTNEIFTETYL